MRIVSLNVWGGRVEGLVEWLVSSNADIYCLQEVFDSVHEGRYSDQVPEGKGGALVRSDLFSVLARALPHHRAYMHPACLWGVRTASGEYVHEALFGIASFVHRRIPVHEMHTNFVFKEFRAIPQYELPTPRVGAVLRMYNEERQKHLVVAHMHGLWDPQGKHHTPERTMQAHRFARMVSQAAGPADQIVVCGDFNVLPDNSLFQLLKSECGVADLVVARGHKSTRTRLYTDNSKNAGKPTFADYLLTTPNIAVRTFEVVHEPVVSDHCPLVLEF